REEKIRYNSLFVEKDQAIKLKVTQESVFDNATELLEDNYPQFTISYTEAGNQFEISLRLTEQEIEQIEADAIDQNLTTLRNRVNELGVSEPIVYRQGKKRIVVQLPGIQDTAEAKKILGKTATLEFHLEAEHDTPRTRKTSYPHRDKRMGVSELQDQIIIGGDQVATAQASFDENGIPQVNITLDGAGGARMHRTTRDKIGKRLGVLFVEQKNKTSYARDAQGNQVAIQQTFETKEIISLATIQAALGTKFRITGLDSPQESSELALLLRAGALAAPMRFVEERTVGPSLGKDNINAGILSMELGMALVLLFTLFYYRIFGVAACLALGTNIVLLVAIMSILSATLTLPGIAGIVLTVGMAVDANVLIFSRIKEELKQGTEPLQAIDQGYDKAFLTILDANLTTLLVAVILYSFGTGPIKGFSVTLSIGIITSMFTAILGTRGFIYLVYRNKKNLSRLAI
ncbi:MAG TPA: protein translocase subunit SecD, partial [Gammaproteobacteria bacterium]|nr:protein translocase subunit SecD [Gammaproteobacteria bacterium]